MSFRLKQIQSLVEYYLNEIMLYIQFCLNKVNTFILTKPWYSFLIFLCVVVIARILFLLTREFLLKRSLHRPIARSRLYRFFEFNLYYFIFFLGLDIFTQYIQKFNREDYMVVMHIFKNFLILYILYINIGYLHSFLSFNFKVYFKRGNKDFVKDGKRLRYLITFSTLLYILFYNLLYGFLGHNIITVIFFVIITKILLGYEKYADLILPKIIPTSMMLSRKHIPVSVIRYLLPVVLYIYTLFYSFYLMIFLANNDKEWARNLLSSILEQHLESLREDSFTEYDVPKEYTDAFMQEDEVQIIRKPDPAALAYDRIDGWLNGSNSSYHLAFSGESGSGKNHVLNRILARYSSVNSFKLELTEKILEESVLLKRLESFVGDVDDEEKKFVIINNAHNLFLSKFNGFKAFDAFFKTINSSSHNVFWFTVWNSNSLNLLKHIYNKYEISSDTINIRPWTNDELKELIFKRHAHIGTEVRFNEELFEIMSHFGTERTKENACDIYFRILAKQTGGNPQAAVNTWLKSISKVDDKVVELHLPERKPVFEVESLNDESLFVFSSILSHELLTVSQIVATTDLSEKVVKYAIKIGVEKGILSRDEDSFHIRKDWLIDVKAILKKRNFIYE